MAYIEDPTQFKNIPQHPTSAPGDMALPQDGGLPPIDQPPTDPGPIGGPPEMPPPSPPPPPMPTDATAVMAGSFARPDQAAAIKPFRSPEMTQFGPLNRGQAPGGQSFGPGAPIVGGGSTFGGAPTAGGEPGNPDDLMRRLQSVLQRG